MHFSETSLEENIDDKCYLDEGNFTCESLDQLCTSSSRSRSVNYHIPNSNFSEGINSYSGIESLDSINSSQLFSKEPTWDNSSKVIPQLNPDDKQLNEVISNYDYLESNDPYFPRYILPCTPLQTQSQALFLQSPKNLIAEDRQIRHQKISNSFSSMLKWDLGTSSSQTLTRSNTSSPDTHDFGKTELDSLKYVAGKGLLIENKAMSLIASEQSDNINFTYPLPIDAPTSPEKISSIKEKPPSESNKFTFVTPSPRHDSFFEDLFTKDLEQPPLKEIDFERQGSCTVPLTPQSGHSHSHILRCNSSLDSSSVCQREPSFQTSLVWSQENPLISTYQSSQSFDQTVPHITAEALALHAQTESSQYISDSYDLDSNLSNVNFNQKMNSIHRPLPTNIRLPRDHSSLNDISFKCQKVKKHDKCRLDEYHRSLSPCLQIRKRKSMKFAKGETPRSSTPNSGSNISTACNFVNYTPRDSLKILTGVAPSGSSKTKARREKEALEKRERLSQIALREILAAGGDVKCLLKEGLLLDD